MRVLIVEDSFTDRMLITTILEDLGHSTFVAENGHQAITMFVECKAELVLLDVLLPDMSGLEIVQNIRAIEQSDWVPVIFLSSRVRAQDIAQGIMMGGDDYLTKPVDDIILKAKMSAMQRIVNMRQKVIKMSNDLKKANQELQKQVGLDGLTGIANRRHLDTQFDRELSACRRFNQELSLILFDVDYFKKFNDEYGHLAGDDCLKMIAVALKESVPRKVDLVARYGGEEFAIILPGTCSKDAYVVAERVRRAIADLNITHVHSHKGHVTASFGIYGKLPTNEDTFEAYAKLADTALYLAKKNGRDTIAISAQQ